MGKRIVVVGAGAVGGYVGGHLTRAGHDVTLIDSWPEHVEAMRRDGLQLSGLTAAERHTVPGNALHLTEVQGLVRQKPIDVAIVSVKSYDTEWATLLIRQYLAPGGFVVSLQNCINEERIAQHVGWGAPWAASRVSSPWSSTSPAASSARFRWAGTGTRSFASANPMGA